MPTVRDANSHPHLLVFQKLYQHAKAACLTLTVASLLSACTITPTPLSDSERYMQAKKDIAQFLHTNLRPLR